MKKNLRYALFDLDNTLYPKSSGLMEEIGRRINQYMIERLGVHPGEVSSQREGYFRSHGTTLNAIRRHYQVDPDEYLDFVHDIPIDRYLDYAPELDRMLETLTLRKIIFTNADAGHARRVLARLGIMHHFESLIDIHFLEFVNKPDHRAYRKALDFIAARPEECVLLEDTTINIKPAVDLGMTTVMVGNGGKADGAHHHIDRITQFGLLLQMIQYSK